MNPYTDQQGVFKNKLGISDEADLASAEYELADIRSSELLSESLKLNVSGFGLDRLKTIHHHLFHDVYDWAGKIRTVPSSKRIGVGLISKFSDPNDIEPAWRLLEQNILAFLHSDDATFVNKLEALIDIFIAANRIHAFPEGNGRALQVFMKQLAAEKLIEIDYTKTNAGEWNQASAASGVRGRLFEHVHWIAVPSDRGPIRRVFECIASEGASR